MAKLALRNDANINHQNINGNTALHFCYLFGFGQTLGKFIIEQGGDENILNDKKLPPKKVYKNGLSSSSFPSIIDIHNKINVNKNIEKFKNITEIDESFQMTGDYMEEYANDDAYDNFSCANESVEAYNSQEELTRGQEIETTSVRRSSDFRSPPPPSHKRLANSGFQSPVVTPTVKRTTSIPSLYPPPLVFSPSITVYVFKADL